ncbi:NUDIX domain-containing protein [Streptomyces boninensis]|uniref:NUDIX domain-containing protein n=1 Tax=Streptomyces boninensis TaxID=2039455 RepID=UPI003B222E3F
MRWTQHSEVTVYENPYLRVNLADVELPDGRRLDHYLVRLPAVAMATVVNERDEALLLWRHRFITQSWGYQLPSGMVDAGEDIAAAAARELEEETGWRPLGLKHLMTLEAANGITDARHHIFWSDRAAYTGEPRDAFESDRRAWVPLADVPELLRSGKLRAAATVAALLRLRQLSQAGRHAGRGARRTVRRVPTDRLRGA